MSPKDMHTRRVGMRWGRACERITIAREAMNQVRGIRDLLPKRVFDRLESIAADVAALELAIWCEESNATQEPKRTRKGG